MSVYFIRGLLLQVILFLICDVFSQSQPLQNSVGPGSFVYTHSGVNKYDFNPAFTSDGYWMYEPTNPKPDSANQNNRQ